MNLNILSSIPRRTPNFWLICPLSHAIIVAVTALRRAKKRKGDYLDEARCFCIADPVSFSAAERVGGSIRVELSELRPDGQRKQFLPGLRRGAPRLGLPELRLDRQ